MVRCLWCCRPGRIGSLTGALKCSPRFSWRVRLSWNTAALTGTWRQMEKLVDLGLVRHIGTSNMTIPKLKLLLADARIAPAVNEMEMHPHMQQNELFEFVRAQGIAPIAYSPIGSPGRPERDRTPEDTVDVEDPAIVSIARRLGVHPAGRSEEHT